MGKVIGIDLGTTNSVVSVMEGGEPRVIVNAEGDRVTPSVVAWSPDGEILVGQIAKRQAVTNATATVHSAKRFIGRRHDECGQDAKRAAFEFVERDGGAAGIKIGDKVLSPEEVSAHVLRKLKKAAEEYLGGEVKEAVVTVPAYFNDAQRQATKDAGKIAGLDVKRIVNEPTAAALAYGMDKDKDELIAVYDFGGGTFDISILEVSDGVVEVISTNGDTRLGGDDLDHTLVDHLIAEFKKETGIDVADDVMVRQRLRDAAETAKIELSSAMEATVNLPFLTADGSGPRHMNVKLTRAKFEALVGKRIEDTLEPARQALQDADKTPADIAQVILVGGSTRIPLVQQTVKSFFGKEPHKGVNPDEVVALGAAIQGGVMSGEVSDVLLLDVTPLSLGLETLGGVTNVLIPRNTTIPATREETFSTADDNQPAVDIHVLQGERTSVGDNRTLGRFRLDGIEPAPRGTPQVKVTFDIDANGILSVTARDERTGKDAKITITAGEGLDEAEIGRLIDEAKDNEGEDARRRQEVDERNQADQLCYSLERSLAEYEGKLAAPRLVEAREAIGRLREAIEKHAMDDIRREREALETLARELATEAAAGEAPEAGGQADEDVIDVEYEDVGDGKAA